ncbi:MAG: radical SAM protein [bacterium]
MINLVRSAAGLAMTRLIKRPVVWGAPVMAMIEPTTACQLRCPHCPTGRGELTRPGGTLTFDRFRRIWDGIRPAPMLLQLWNQGEPLVNCDTPEIIRYASASGARVVMSSNVELLADVDDLANQLVASGLAELILSLDGATPESHAEYRVGGDFAKVEEGIRRMVAVKRTLGVRHPRLTWQFLLFRHNLNEILRARRLAKEWGVDRIVFKTAQLESFEREEGERWLPEKKELRRYDLRDERWALRRRERPFCQRILTSTVIQADGGVVPCCFDKNGEFVMGNVLATPFDEIWRNEQYSRFRYTIQNGTRPPMCGNCTEGLRHLYVHL